MRLLSGISELQSYCPDMNIMECLSLVSVNTKVTPAVAKLSVPPKMTKTEVAEYLTKIYNVPVLKVNTTLFLGNLWTALAHI